MSYSRENDPYFKAQVAYLEMFGSADSARMSNAGRIAANRSAGDQLQEVLEQAVAENKRVDWELFINRFHPRSFTMKWTPNYSKENDPYYKAHTAYLNTLGWANPVQMSNAIRVAENNSAGDQLQAVMEQAVAENKPADWGLFIDRFYPPKNQTNSKSPSFATE